MLNLDVAFIFRIAQTANKSELSTLSASESSRTLRPFISIKKNLFLNYLEPWNQWAAFFPKPATKGKVCSSPKISSAEELEILVFSIFSNTNNLLAKEIENNIKDNTSNEIEEIRPDNKKTNISNSSVEDIFGDEQTFPFVAGLGKNAAHWF